VPAGGVVNTWELSILGSCQYLGVVNTWELSILGSCQYLGVVNTWESSILGSRQYLGVVSPDGESEFVTTFVSSYFVKALSSRVERLTGHFHLAGEIDSPNVGAVRTPVVASKCLFAARPSTSKQVFPYNLPVLVEPRMAGHGANRGRRTKLAHGTDRKRKKWIPLATLASRYGEEYCDASQLADLSSCSVGDGNPWLSRIDVWKSRLATPEE
jgi:hypothetical protein